MENLGGTSGRSEGRGVKELATTLRAHVPMIIQTTED